MRGKAARRVIHSPIVAREVLSGCNNEGPALSIKNMMYYVYALKHPKNSFLYVGYTDNLERRCQQHRHDEPGWKLAYFEAYISEKDARIRERKLKHNGSTLGHLRKRIENTLKEL